MDETRDRLKPSEAIRQGHRIELADGRFMVDGRERILFSGEIHYFRLDRDDWRDRLVDLRGAGAHAVASYLPWIAHELPDGTIDVTGATEAWRDIGAFCDLAHELGLYVICRPGPFVMAELKNEGIPHRIYSLPGTVPTTWGGRSLPTRDLDYLAPRFLSEVGRWYDAVLPVLASRLYDRGGPVIAVQLDNEVGMLAWLSNSPAFSEPMAASFLDWLEGSGQIDRHPALASLGESAAPDRRRAALRYLQQPPAGSAAVMNADLIRFSRVRFRRYTDTLAAMVTERGIDSVPLLVNIHGTSAGRGLTYPIGISQLLGTWRNRPGMAAGSDMYLGDLTVGNVADFVVGNVFARAVSGPNQPLMALEFEAGDGNYGEDLGTLVPPEAVGLRTRLAHGLGNRLMNFYLYAGGVNPPLARDPARPGGDGIDRIAFTGEYHGFAAPLGPTGRPNSTRAELAAVVHALNEVEQQAAGMVPWVDLVLGYVSDHYATEYHPPGDRLTQQIHSDLARFRGLGPREVLGRALVLGGFGLDAVDLCAHPELDDPELDETDGPARAGWFPAELDVARHPVLAVASAHYLAEEVQRRLVDYVAAGGRLFLAGVLPSYDELGADCTVLAAGLGLTLIGERGDREIDDLGTERQYFPTVQVERDVLVQSRPPRPNRREVRVGYAQLIGPSEASAATSATKVLVREVQSGAPCAVEVDHGRGRAVVLATDYPCDLTFYRLLLARLGVTARWRTDAADPGVVLLGLVDPETGAEMLHLVNVAPYPVTFSLWRGDEQVTPAPLTVGARTGRLLRFTGADLRQ